METGLLDKNGKPISVGDKTSLVLDNGEVREFDVCVKTVNRVVKCHPDFDDKYDLFPCVDENGISDVSKMEVITR